MWTIEPKIPLSLWWALVAATVAALVYYFARRDWSLSPLRRGIITVLLGLCVVGPLAIALNPTWIEPVPPLPGQPMISVLVDGTMSMQTADASPGETKTRWQSAIHVAGRLEPDRDVELRSQVFDHELHPLTKDLQANPESGDWPRGHRSDLTNVLRECIRSGSPAGHAVLLVSDGAHNVGSIDGLLSAAREAKSLDVPVYTVTVGSTVESKNLSLAARSPRMISFADNPLVLRVRIGQSGLAGRSTQVALMVGENAIQSRQVRLADDPAQEITFVLSQPPKEPLQRYRIVAAEIEGEATNADNQTTILVQQLQEPIGALLLEGKPYWDSKFLARNLGSDPVVELTSMVQLAKQRFLVRKYPRAPTDSEKRDETATSAQPTGNDTQPADAVGWEIQRETVSPLDSLDTLSKYRLVILGRDADAFLTEKSIENVRHWISRDGGCLMCARGAPANEIVSKLSEILPVRWSAAAESRFRTKVSQYGYDAAVFDPLMPDGSDPLAALPSLSTSAVPKTRVGLPQVLVQSVLDQSGTAIPVVTYQPYGRGQSIVVEGAGMWRWAFLPPQHAAKDKIYPTLWQSLIQWIVSQQDLMPGQKVGIRSDRATFLTGDRATATVLISAPEEFQKPSGELDLGVLLDGPGLPLPRRLAPAASGGDLGLFR
ncbi:MAG TPA: vWA domain-containing protein, partial [Lacipirellulaceae bacterium]|nr:vWA domain-containing protein [Lacipirellulaceae bacterium]